MKLELSKEWYEKNLPYDNPEIGVGQIEPFPWKCRSCNKTEVFIAAIDYTIDVLHNCELIPVTIPNLQIPICLSCGEKIFTEAVDEQINNAFALRI